MATYCGKSKRTQIRLVEVEDAEFILGLRTNPQLNKHISSVDDSLEKQQEWIRSYKERENQKTEYYWVIEDIKGNRYGLCRIYGRSFENNTMAGGSWVVAPGSPNFIAFEGALLGFMFAFSLGVQKMLLDARKENAESVHKFEDIIGSVKTGEDELNVYYELTAEAFEAAKGAKLKRYLERYF